MIPTGLKQTRWFVIAPGGLRWLKCATFSGPHRGYRCQARAGQTISCAAWPMVYDDVDVWTQLPRILTRNADYLAITRISVGLQTHNHMMRGNQGIAFLFFSVFFGGGRETQNPGFDPWRVTREYPPPHGL